MTVPLHMVEIESEGSSNGTGATAVVGTTQYFRLKDKRGYASIMHFFCNFDLLYGAFIRKSCLPLIATFIAIQTPPFSATTAITH
jgi:hypothetical protein